MENLVSCRWENSPELLLVNAHFKSMELWENFSNEIISLTYFVVLVGIYGWLRGKPIENNVGEIKI